MKNQLLSLSLIALLSGGINNSYSQNSELSEDSKLMIFGESNHMSEKQKDFMVNSIDSLKEQGYNYFAIELPVRCDNSVQSYLKSNKKDKDLVIDQLLELWPSRGALEVAYNFYKNGFKVVPIDEGIEEENSLVGWKRINDTLMEFNNERDFYMAKNIEKILEKDSCAKIVAYTGAFHANKRRNYTFSYKYPTMAGILKKKGINQKTICLIDKNNNGYINTRKEKLNKSFEKIIYIE